MALFGVECASGDTFTDGTVNYTMTSMHVPDAVISLAVAPKDSTGQANFSKALNRFTKEDPTFRVHRDEESAQTIISGMGELHLEIYIERMKREYDCEVIAGKPQVAYRETITQRGEFNYTHKKQTGGSGQYGKVCGYIEPLPAGCGPDATSSWTTSSAAPSRASSSPPATRASARRSRRAADRLPDRRRALRHQRRRVATRSTRPRMAFKTAALMGFREAYAAAKPTILEPIMKVEVQAPEEFQGAVMGQLNQRRGTIISHREAARATCEAMAEVPLNDMFGYSTDLRSATQGKGEFTMEFPKYAAVPKAASRRS